MSKIPCRICPSCGMHHDLSVIKCDECGEDIMHSVVKLVEIDSIPAELFGQIDENLPVYVQKCPACGTLNYSLKNEPCSVCYKCHKKRISSIEPVLFVNEESTKPLQNTDDVDEGKKMTFPEDYPNNANETIDSEDEPFDEETLGWVTALKDSIGSSISTSFQIEQEPKNNHPDNKKGIATNLEDSNEDDAEADWDFLNNISGLKEETREETREEQKDRDITLTAIRYGRLSFTVKAKQGCKYLLGRSAEQSEFLSFDGRVSNEHCYLLFRNGSWYVKDNHSANGTAVNSRDIGLNGERILNDGDELKLGHHNDSMAFKITI